MILLFFITKLFICSGTLYGYYWLFLRNKKFHHYNRFYLLGALLLSVIVPFMNIPLALRSNSTTHQVVYQVLDVMTATRWEEPAAAVNPADASASLFSLTNLLYLVYIPGVAIVLFTLVRSLLYIRRIARRYVPEKINDLTFYNTHEKGTPFSFFRSVFWNEQLSFNSPEGQQIFRHELFHVRQQHTADILLTEIIIMVFWFNPFFHLMKKEIKAIHEFLADQYAISGKDRYAYAELLVFQTLKQKNGGLSHYFFQNHIKRRIAMITQTQKTRYTWWSRVMILPVAVVLTGLLAFTIRRSGHNTEGLPGQTGTPAVIAPLDLPLTIVVDAGHGGTDAGAHSTDGSVLEKNLTLSIARQIEALAPDYNVRVVMTRDQDVLPGNKAQKNDGLRYRTQLAREVNADLLLSVHVAAAELPAGQTTAPESGFEVFITNRNQPILPASRMLGSSLLTSLKDLYHATPVLKQRQDAGIWVLDQAPCPAALVECGYLTNPADVQFMTVPANQKKIARRLLEGIITYNHNRPEKTSALTDTVPAAAREAEKAAREQARKSREEEQKARQEKLRATRDKEALEERSEALRREYELHKKLNEKQRQNYEEMRAKLVPMKEKMEALRKDQEKQRELYKKQLLALQDKEKGQKEQQEQMEQKMKAFLDKQKKYEENQEALARKMKKINEQYELQQTKERAAMEKKWKEMKENVKEQREEIRKERPQRREPVRRDSTIRKRDAAAGENKEEAVILNRQQQLPQFPGGREAWKKYLATHLIYPPEAREKSIEGVVVVRFMVDRNGNILRPQVISGPAVLHPAATAVIQNSPRWQPARDKGRRINAYCTQAIAFSLKTGSRSAYFVYG